MNFTHAQSRPLPTDCDKILRVSRVLDVIFVAIFFKIGKAVAELRKSTPQTAFPLLIARRPYNSAYEIFAGVQLLADRT